MGADVQSERRRRVAENFGDNLGWNASVSKRYPHLAGNVLTLPFELMDASHRLRRAAGTVRTRTASASETHSSYSSPIMSAAFSSIEGVAWA